MVVSTDRVREQLGKAPARSWVAFLRLWPAVATLLALGYSIRALQRACKAEGLWTHGYFMFRQHVRRAQKLKPAPAPTQAVESSAVTLESGFARSTVVTGQPLPAEHGNTDAAAEQGPLAEARARLLARAVRGNPLLERRERPPSTHQPSGKAKHLY